jgi:hypothetical protein
MKRRPPRKSPEGSLTASLPETAVALGICEDAARRAARNGQIPVIQIGRLKRVPRAWIMKTVQADR